MFYPDVHFDKIYDITPEFLARERVFALVLDVDNTLVTYQTERPDEEVRKWIEKMRESGICITIASNNRRERVEKFCEGLDVFFTYKSGKPKTKCIKRSCERFGIKAENTAVVGDQIFTDVLCARFGGARAYLVNSLGGRENPFIRFKRLLEKPILALYKKHHPSEFGGKGNDYRKN